MGYRTAVLTDPGTDSVGANMQLDTSEYEGYWKSCNELARLVDSQIYVFAADDMSPDPRHRAEEIGEQFLTRFPDGYGVMQPTGDTLKGTDKICGSPWIGRKFIETAYFGQGPYWPEYGHFYGDEELFEVSSQEGILWQRPDLTQYHHHWCRPGGPSKTAYQSRNSDRWWSHDKEIFQERKAKGFPGFKEAKAEMGTDPFRGCTL